MELEQDPKVMEQLLFGSEIIVTSDDYYRLALLPQHRCTVQMMKMYPDQTCCLDGGGAGAGAGERPGKLLAVLGVEGRLVPPARLVWRKPTGNKPAAPNNGLDLRLVIAVAVPYCTAVPQDFKSGTGTTCYTT